MDGSEDEPDPEQGAGADRRGGGGEARGPAGTAARGGKDGPQLVRGGGHRWSDEAEAIFLDSLAASNNARWAAERCGFSPEAIYARARRDPAFAERMAAARAMGHGRLDEALNRAAEDFLAGRPAAADSPFPQMTVQDAIAIQKLNRPDQGGGGGGRRPAWPARRRSLEEVHDSILRKLSVAMLFEAGRALLHGRFPELEAQLCGMIAGGDYKGPGTSPDRADAMVWVVTELTCLPKPWRRRMLQKESAWQRIRRL